MFCRGFLRCGAALLLTFLMIVPAFLLPDSTEAIPSPTVLRIGFMDKLDSLNPYMGVSDASSVFYGLVYDALTCVDNELNPAPNLALGTWAVPLSDPEMVKYDYPYGSVWQYNLTRNALWSDNAPFTADDVVWNLNMNSQYFDYLWKFQPYTYFMKNATKIDDFTVRVHFFERATNEPRAAAYAYSIPMYMLPRHRLMSTTPAEIGFSWTGVFQGEALPIVGTGPFIPTSTLYQDWLTGDSITLVRNPYYHSMLDFGRYVKFDQVQLEFYDDTLAMTYALKNNLLDVARFPAGPYFDLKKDVTSGALRNIATFDGPKITEYFVEIGICQNVDGGANPSRVDPVIKHALAMSTNKSYIVENFYMGYAEEGSTLIPPVSSYWHYEPTESEKWKYDLSAAAALLQANGYIDTDSNGIREATAGSPAVLGGLVPAGTALTYEILVRAGAPEEKETAQWLQSQWSQIGVSVSIKVLDPAILNTIVYSYQSWDMMIYYWRGDIDPNFQLYALSSMAINGWNDIRYSNDFYDENYSMSVGQMDRNQRKVYTDSCQRTMYQDGSYIILAYPDQMYAWRTDTFYGWGDWLNQPGRSLDNFWTANPLLFDLYPTGWQNSPPSDFSLTSPPRVKPQTDVTFEAKAKHADGVLLVFSIDFGDGEFDIYVGEGGTGWQIAEFTHQYLETGVYNVTVWVTDGFAGSGHLINETARIVVSEREPYSTAFALMGAGVALLSTAAVVLVYLLLRGRETDLKFKRLWQ